jgi:hypothetical protein
MTWLTVTEAAIWTGRTLTEVVDAMMTEQLPYLCTDTDLPFEWLIAQPDLTSWAVAQTGPSA